MESCVFCDIVNKKNSQSREIVYQDRHATAFMDLQQPHPGHVLIVPNKHYMNIFELDEKLAGHLFKVTTKMAKAVREAFKPHGIDIYQCNGKCAGQSVFHLHIHVFPRERDDGLFRIYPKDYEFSSDEEQLIQYSKMIQKYI